MSKRLGYLQKLTFKLDTGLCIEVSIQGGKLYLHAPEGVLCIKPNSSVLMQVDVVEKGND